MTKPEDKPFAIPKSMVWEAWRQVRANKGAPGVDGQALGEFEADLRDNLYKIWNRMSSGSSFPPSVMAVEIPKPHGDGVRLLGVPYAFDSWMARNHPGCPFERYADDTVVHCKSKRQAEAVLAGIAMRMQEVGLRLHPEKTRIVYCRDSNRRERYENTAFTFLGFAFRSREARNRDGEYFTSFLPAISPEALKAKGARLREMRIHRRTDLTLEDLADWLNPIVAGWMNYYGRYSRAQMFPLLRRVNLYLRRWTSRKYRRLRTYKRFKRWWTGLIEREPGLFAHWKWERAH